MSAQTASATELYPDGELIGLCHECDALYLRFQATFQDELTLQPGLALQEKRNLITRLQGNVLDQICAIHATTLEGLRARNRVNVLGGLLDAYWIGRMAQALHRDTRHQLAVVKGAGPGPSISIPAPPGDGQRASRDHDGGQDDPAGVPQPARAGRRQPDRIEITNSHLDTILHGCSAARGVDQVDKPGDGPGLAGSIIIRFVLSVPSWAVLALLAYILVRTLGFPARS